MADIEAVAAHPGDGESLTLAAVRGAEELSVSVTFGATPEEGSAS